MPPERRRHVRRRPVKNNKMLLNIVVVVALLIIVLAIGVFIGKSFTSKTPGPTTVPTAMPGDESNSIVLPSSTPTLTPLVSPTITATVTVSPSVPASNITPTPTIVPSPSPTATAVPTITPTPTAQPTSYPTEAPTITPTPTPSPASSNPFLQDEPFYESISPLKSGDNLAPVDNSYIAGNGPVYIDLANSYMGSGYAYPGDTLGVKLRLYNQGPAINTVGTVTMNLSRMYYTQDGGTTWVQMLSQQYDTNIQIGSYGATYKNISYQVPNSPGIAGFYKIYIMFYVNGQFTAGVVKELNIFE
jgi:hypothetical protein